MDGLRAVSGRVLLRMREVGAHRTDTSSHLRPKVSSNPLRAMPKHRRARVSALISLRLRRESLLPYGQVKAATKSSRKIAQCYSVR